jgi:hypothetical protein
MGGKYAKFPYALLDFRPGGKRQFETFTSAHVVRSCGHPAAFALVYLQALVDFDVIEEVENCQYRFKDVEPIIEGAAPTITWQPDKDRIPFDDKPGVPAGLFEPEIDIISAIAMASQSEHIAPLATLMQKPNANYIYLNKTAASYANLKDADKVAVGVSKDGKQLWVLIRPNGTLAVKVDESGGVTINSKMLIDNIISRGIGTNQRFTAGFMPAAQGWCIDLGTAYPMRKVIRSKSNTGGGL